MKESSAAVAVMAGLVPAIHVAGRSSLFKMGARVAAWMPGTSPGMTENAVMPVVRGSFEGNR